MMNTFSVMTVNLWNYPYMRESRFEALRALIDAEQPDILLTQETPMRRDGATYVGTLERRGLFTHAVRLRDPADRRMVGGYESANAIVSPHRLFDVGSIRLSGADVASHAPYATVRIAGVPVHVLSVHAARGSTGGAARLGQAMVLSKHAEAIAGDTESPTGIVIAGGDFNADAASDEIRFLTGVHTPDEKSSFWVDAWAHTRPGSRGVTVSGSNPNALLTAQVLGAAQSVERRVDYLFSYGRVHDRSGAPEQVRVLDRMYAGVHISNHYPVVARFRI